MAILHKVSFGFLHWCEGCRCCHGIWLWEKNPVTGALWTWNGSLDRPTFAPSVLIDRRKAEGVMHICHSNVTDGKIYYHMDSTHNLKGQTLPLEDF